MNSLSLSPCLSPPVSVSLSVSLSLFLLYLPSSYLHYHALAAVTLCYLLRHCVVIIPLHVTQNGRVGFHEPLHVTQAINSFGA